ncbi:MAG: 2-oxo-4-hydroxy-4-carboxy-5-ureidoimidazoline decarboxylase [Bacteroidetes bacterium]|nr:2-oxo-4-hydroxy-4-carboxy-5-ureidoimidazoline decarboxylase [Bacteroidota bacterium]
MTIADFDHLSTEEKKILLFNCCGCTAWVKAMMEIFPVNDLIDLLEYAEEKWYECNPADWLEAFQHHPKIGDTDAIHPNSTLSNDFASKEQQGVDAASAEILNALKKANEDYLEHFGYIFIVFATGKSAQEMLDILNSRMINDPHDELNIAAAEQNKITRLRLEKLFL